MDRFKNKICGNCAYYKSEAMNRRVNLWFVGLVGGATAILAIGTLLAVRLERYDYIYPLLALAVALMVAGVVVYVKQRGRVGGKPTTRHEEYTDVAEDEITIEKIVSYVRECGSLVTCVPRDEGGYSIIIRYDDEVYNIVWEDRLVQVVGRFWFGNEEEPSGAFIQAFMFASNIVMSNKHFVQTYIDKDVCVYMTSGYVRTMTDIREYIPVYLSIVKESIALHRHYTTEIMKDIEKMQSESRPMTTKDSRVN